MIAPRQPKRANPWRWFLGPRPSTHNPSNETGVTTDMPTFTGQEVTLVAAMMAAAISLINLVLGVRAQRAAEFRSAHREAIGPFLSRLGDGIHQTVALSSVALRANTAETQTRKCDEASHAAKDLKEIRREARYGLWGIEKGIRELTRLPDWLAHTRRYPEAAERLVEAGAALAEALDSAVVRSYLRGRRPTLLGRALVRWRTAQLRKEHEAFKKTPRDQRA